MTRNEQEQLFYKNLELKRKVLDNDGEDNDFTINIIRGRKSDG